jgi:hypothetical protein
VQLRHSYYSFTEKNLFCILDFRKVEIKDYYNFGFENVQTCFI